jgi:hypothetical protein
MNLNSESSTKQPDSIELNKNAATHSGVGIASFIIGLLVWVAIALMQVWYESAVQQSQAAGYGLLLSALSVCLVPFIIVGIILGIVAMRQKNRKRLFTVLGLIFNGIFVILLGAAACYYWFLILGGYLRLIFELLGFQ